GRKNNLFGASLSQAYWGASLLLSCLVYSPWCHSRSVFSPKKEVPELRAYRRRFYMDCLSSLYMSPKACLSPLLSAKMRLMNYLLMVFLTFCFFSFSSFLRFFFLVVLSSACSLLLSTNYMLNRIA